MGSPEPNTERVRAAGLLRSAGYEEGSVEETFPQSPICDTNLTPPRIPPSPLRDLHVWKVILQGAWVVSADSSGALLS